MAIWEYAFTEASGDYVITWFADSNGGRKLEVWAQNNTDVVMMQQVASLCGEGWEIFQVTAHGGSSKKPGSFGYHFRRVAEL